MKFQNVWGNKRTLGKCSKPEYEKSTQISAKTTSEEAVVCVHTSQQAVVCVHTSQQAFPGPSSDQSSTQAPHYPNCTAMISQYGDLLKVYVKQINKGTLMQEEDYIICALRVQAGSTQPEAEGIRERELMDKGLWSEEL